MAKSIRTATPLAALVGLVAVCGVGHIYLGRVRRGVVLLIISLVLYFITMAQATEFLQIAELPEDKLKAAKDNFSAQTRFIGLLFWSIIYIVFCIWQIVDARKIARKYTYYGDAFLR